MLISQTGGYFENPCYGFLEELLLFLLDLKWKLQEKAFSNGDYNKLFFAFTTGCLRRSFLPFSSIWFLLSFEEKLNKNVVQQKSQKISIGI